MNWPAQLRRFRKQPKARQALLIEACVRLVWARLLLSCLSFRQLTRFFNPTLGRSVLPTAERERLRREVGWAIERVADCLPGKTTCFPRGIAAQRMCRWRGIDTIMYYGAGVDPATGLRAHVWVQDGAEGVVGHLDASQYGVLARFPALDA